MVKADNLIWLSKQFMERCFHKMSIYFLAEEEEELTAS